jgi:hypothetical protein
MFTKGRFLQNGSWTGFMLVALQALLNVVGPSVIVLRAARIRASFQGEPTRSGFPISLGGAEQVGHSQFLVHVTRICSG